MTLRMPRSTLTDTLFPSSPLVRSVGAALAGAIVFGVLSLVSGSGSDNKALEARKAPPPADLRAHVRPTPSLPFTPVAPFSLRSEEPTSELQSLMRIRYAVFCCTQQNTTMLIINHLTHMHNLY